MKKLGGKKSISDLAASIATRKCALFAGAGLTAESGGTTWTKLIKFLKEKFGYSSPLTDYFQIIGDMYRKFGAETVYEAVKNRLKDARIDEPISKLTSLPWFTVFTTNYDLALGKSLSKNQSLDICAIVTGQEFALTGLQSEMLCVKLMGSLDIPCGQPGSMVLTPGDLATAREERVKIFDILTTHAANLSFLFIGYSFDDGLFLEILEKLMKNIGTPKNTYYAVFKEMPDEEKSYLLKQYGVEVIVADLEAFAEKLSKEVALRNPADFTLKRVPIGSDIVPIDSTKVANFLSLYNPVFFEDLENDVSAYTFFKGKTDSFKPFGLNWHFQRKEIEEVVKEALKKRSSNEQPCIVTVEGNPGTGRTFIILAAIYELIKKYRAIAIKIPSYAISPIPSSDDLADFLKEIEESAKKRGIKNPERIVFWAEFSLDDTVISQFKKLSSDCKYPTSLIFEDLGSPQPAEDIFQREESTLINADVDLSEKTKESLADYILNITRTHKFPEIDEEETYSIINEEKRFLPIMYRTLDPARRSINRIVQEEFNGISDPDVQRCISLCSLATSVDLEMPVTVLRKALSQLIGKQLSYPETFEISTDKAKAFIKESIDPRTNPLVSIYHSLIAQHIVKLVGMSKMDAYLLNIAKTVNIKSRIEAELISNLLITKGVNCVPGSFRPFTDDGLEKALLELKDRQPARPIIHHLARLYANKDTSDKEIIPLLEEALAEPKELYVLEERKENVMTTLAKIKWDQNKEQLLSQPREDPEIQEIIDLLIKAREDPAPNIHAYDVHVRILKELWQSKDEEKKMVLVNEAVEVINECLDSCGDDPDATERMRGLLIESLSEIDPEMAGTTAKELLDDKKDGTGYYTLARIEYHKNSNLTRASIFLDKAMSGENYPPGAIALKIDIILQDRYPNYDYLMKLADLLSSDIRFKDNWKSAYHKAVVYAINGRYDDAVKYFKISHRMAPRTLQRKVQIFWMEEVHRKVHKGKIGMILTEREGRIYSHNIEGWEDNIFFDPRRQDKIKMMRSGLFVNFELGFSPRGPIAFDVRPSKEK